jgi:DNA-binding transcriptional ArsR family regulator
MTGKANVSEELSQFMSRYTNDYCALQLILFLALHPRASFSEPTILHALGYGGSKNFLRQTLAVLVENGIVKKHIEQPGVPLYSLSGSAPVCKLAQELIRLDVNQRRIVMRQLHPTAPGAELVCSVQAV